MSGVKRLRTRGFQSILCAVDFSPQSSAALQVAVQVARRTGGKVTALYVEDPLLGHGAAAVGYDTALLRKSTVEQLQKLMQRVAYPAGLGPEVWSVETVLGNPARAIVTFARKLNADLIVMGTNGRRGAGKLFFGSTAESVLRRAPAPVLIVPRRRRPRPTGQTPLTGHLLGAIELGASGRGDARRMADVAKTLGASLILLHVVPITQSPAWFGPQLQPYDHRRLAAARSSLDALARTVGDNAIDCRVVLGRPSEEIPAVAVDTKAGLIALILRPRRGLFGPRQGTTTYQVISGSTIPVLALPVGHRLFRA